MNEQPITLENNLNPEVSKKNFQTKLIIAIGILGGLASLAFAVAAIRFWNHGSTLQALRSRSGDSVAEAFYQEVGGYGYAFGNFSCGLAFCLLTVLAIYFSYFLQNRK